MGVPTTGGGQKNGAAQWLAAPTRFAALAPAYLAIAFFTYMSVMKAE
jgi:hypothetical protein